MIYFDHSATTPLSDRVIDSMTPYFKDKFGNAVCSHDLGTQSNTAVAMARGKVSSIIGASHKDIYFTSGATESNNWVIRGRIDSYDGDYLPHIVTSAIEHPSILHTLEQLQHLRLCTYTAVGVDKHGYIDFSEYCKVLEDKNEHIVLCTVMLVNNEIGVIQDIERLSTTAHKWFNIPFHTDATQAVGKTEVNINDLDVDFMSLSAHKLYGPKGVGALYIRYRSELSPLLLGGPHENYKRAGTENVPGIVGFGEACLAAKENLNKNVKHVQNLKNRLYKSLFELGEEHDFRIVDNNALNSVPHIFNFSIPDTNTRKFLDFMNASEIYLSAGSACSAGKAVPSTTVKALGKSPEDVLSTVRISFGKDNTTEEIDTFIKTFETYIQLMR